MLDNGERGIERGRNGEKGPERKEKA